MDCFAPKAVQSQMVAAAMGRQMTSRNGQFFSTSVEDLFNRVPMSPNNLVTTYASRLVRIMCFNSLVSCPHIDMM